MKKLLLSIFSSIICLSLFAQVTTDVNRLLITEKNGDIKAFKLDNVDYIEFKTIEGEVAANVNVLEANFEKAVINVVRTPACDGFKIACFPSIQISSLNDEQLANAIDKDAQNIYYQDCDKAEMTGMTLQPNTSYTIATVGIDSYGVLCDVRKAEFISPSKPLIGTPQVTIEEVDVQSTSITLKFTPNADVSKYSFIIGEKGLLLRQFESFAPMFGFDNIGEMIEMLGIQKMEETDYTWDSLTTDTEYEVWVQAWDKGNTMAEYQVYEITTMANGGDGVAEVEITLGDYKLMDWDGEMLPSQFITYTPNDQASAYRFNVYLANEYDAESELIKADLCSEPPMPMYGWFFYETLTTDYQINPNTECVVIAAAKNINGEWGPVKEVRFTTPAEVIDPSGANMLPSKHILKRADRTKRTFQPGRIPMSQSQKKVILNNK